MLPIDTENFNDQYAIHTFQNPSIYIIINLTILTHPLSILYSLHPFLTDYNKILDLTFSNS